VSLLILVQAQLRTELCSNNDANTTNSFATAIVSLFEKLLVGRGWTVNLWFGNWECQQEFIFEKVMQKNRGKFVMQKIITIYSTDTNPVLVISSCDRFFSLEAIPQPQPLLYYCPNLNAEELHNQVIMRRDDRLTGRNLKFLVKSADNFIDLKSFKS